ncbi:alpha/beta hydrolase [Lysinibacillus sp. 54212]|uniref:alpha/beta hydrolase n=1 Tax=Lysinibacillus sp. 54212 TaxID=3119829 RepID=UPI002FC8B724
MNKLEQFVKMSDGKEVFMTTYEPQQEIKGHIHILHGMAEHSGRYADFASVLVDQGYFVSTHDHRGHGKTAENGGRQGYFEDENGFDRVVRDVFEVTELIRRDRALPQVILFGHSMGSFIARRYMQLFSSTIKAAILCGTGTATPLHVVGNRVARLLAKSRGTTKPSEILNELSFGSFNKSVIDAKTAYDWLSRDEKQVQTYMDDPHCGFVATNQFYVDLTGGLLLINRKDEISRIRADLPVLLISGSRDPVGDFGKGVMTVGEQFVEAGMEKVVVHICEDMRHEILNEQNKEYVYEVILRWLNDETEN